MMRTPTQPESTGESLLTGIAFVIAVVVCAALMRMYA